MRGQAVYIAGVLFMSSFGSKVVKVTIYTQLYVVKSRRLI